MSVLAVHPDRPALPARQSPGQIAWRKFRRDTSGMIGLGGLVFVIALILMAPFLSQYSPEAMNFDALLQPPSPGHPFGTDELGRDIFSRVLWGGRESLRVGLSGVAIALTGGLLVGLVSGYFGGWVDEAIQRIVDILLAFPTILFLLAIIAILGPSLSTVLLAIGIASVPTVARLVRGSVLSVRNMEYIDAARVLGASDIRIMLVHILPNIFAPVLIYSTLGLGSAIMLTAGLSYVGLGAQPPSPEWGAMLNDGRKFLQTAWWMSVFPGLAVFIVVMCINLLGEGLRNVLDPKLYS